jgi:diguanylate cyclase (GGDEF)-like protein
VQRNDWRLYAVVNRERFFSRINRQLLVLMGVVLAVTIMLFVLTMFALRPVIRALLKEKQLFELSHHDGLTSLYNHAYLQELLDRELSLAQRHARQLSVLMFDIDWFKQVNDTYGHQTGDGVLRRIGQVVKHTIRVSDLAARYGGEEFMVILPETGREGAVELAERLRTRVAAERFHTASGDLGITISVGVVTYDAGDADCPKHEIIEATDRALYASKNAGRNCVTAATLPVPA